MPTHTLYQISELYGEVKVGEYPTEDDTDAAIRQRDPDGWYIFRVVEAPTAQELFFETQGDMFARGERDEDIFENGERKHHGY